jgi:hypothetical protein
MVSDSLYRSMKLRTAVAFERAQYVAGKAFTIVGRTYCSRHRQAQWRTAPRPAAESSATHPHNSRYFDTRGTGPTTPPARLGGTTSHPW